MVRRLEGERGEGRGRGVGVGDSRKLRRLYIFWGEFCVSQFGFFSMSDFSIEDGMYPLG